MLTQSNLSEIKKTVQEFFQKMTFEVEVDFLPQTEQTLPINLKADEPQILIGERGQTLAEIQHLLKAILRRKIEAEEAFYIDLDINDYKKKKNEYLRELARSVADEVSLSKKEKILGPMPPYERRVIHMELAGRSDVVSESIGEGPERRVGVRPSA